MTAPIIFRVGDAFAYTGPATGLSSFAGWVVSASLVRGGAAAVAVPVPASWANESAGIVRLYQPDTSLWPTGEYSLVLRFTSPAGDAISSNGTPVRIVR